MESTEKNYNFKSYNDTLSSTISSKGQVTIPVKIREMLDAEYGDKIQFSQNDQNEIIIKVIKKDTLLSLFGSLPPKGEQGSKDWNTIRTEAREEKLSSKYTSDEG